MAIDISQIRTQAQVLGNTDGSGNGMRDFIYALTVAADGIDGRTIDTEDHEFSTQSYLNPFASEQANSYFYDDFLSRAISIDALLEVDNDLNYKTNLAASLNLTLVETQTLIDTIFNYHADTATVVRKTSTQATCQQQAFRRTTPPTVDILIPAGTSVGTTPTSIDPAVSFQTVSSITMKASLASSYLNPINGLYEIRTSIIAANTGVDGNQSAGAVNVLVSNIIGIDSTYNYAPSSGGLDQETNAQLVDEIKAASQNHSSSTEQGFFETVFSVQNVSDTVPIGTGNVLMTRDLGLGGAVDVYVQSNNNQLIEVQDEIQAYSGTAYVLENQPVEANLTTFPISINAFDASGVLLGALAYPADFTFSKDRSDIQWSSQAVDSITITPAGVITLAGLGAVATLGFTYTYDSLIKQIQDVFDSDTGHDLTVSILVRKAKYTLFNPTIQAQLLPGFTVQDVTDSISTILSGDFSIANRLLGVEGIRAEMISSIQSQAATVGISQVITTSTGITFTLSDGNDSTAETSAVVDADLNVAINAAEFLQLGTVTVTSV